MRIAYIRHGKIKLAVFAVLVIILAAIAISGAARSAAESFSKNTSAKLPIYCTDNTNREIALTINCAWGADDIDGILDTLDEYGIKATFFAVGTWAEKYPDKLRLIYERGHEIGNHSYSHKLPSRSTYEQLSEEIEKCSEAIEKAVGTRPVLYRAPSGDITDTILDLTDEKGMFNIKWSVDSIDWRDDMTKEAIINRVLGRTVSGSILLFHNDTKYTKDILPEIIKQLQKEDYKFVKVSELIYKENYYIDNTGKQCSIK